MSLGWVCNVTSTLNPESLTVLSFARAKFANSGREGEKQEPVPACTNHCRQIKLWSGTSRFLGGRQVPSPADACPAEAVKLHNSTVY